MPVAREGRSAIEVLPDDRAEESSVELFSAGEEMEVWVRLPPWNLPRVNCSAKRLHFGARPGVRQ